MKRACSSAFDAARGPGRMVMVLRRASLMDRFDQLGEFQAGMASFGAGMDVPVSRTLILGYRRAQVEQPPHWLAGRGGDGA